MNREGQFRISATGPNHCGVDEDLTIKYHMICVCEDSLDHRGFLFDQINVDQYFQGIQSSALSCEKLTMKCARKLMSLIKDENPDCVIRRMSLTLSPAPFKASMTCDMGSSKIQEQPKKKKKFIKI